MLLIMRSVDLFLLYNVGQRLYLSVKKLMNQERLRTTESEPLVCYKLSTYLSHFGFPWSLIPVLKNVLWSICFLNAQWIITCHGSHEAVSVVDSMSNK
jgi:hypothetical protein